MKLKSVLVFSVVIASLTFVAIAGDVKEFDLKFKGGGQFGQYIDDDGLLVFYPAVFVPPDQLPHVPDSLNVSHLGLSEVDWEIRVNPSNFPEFVDGWFTITGANGDSLEGDYSGFVLDLVTGEYDLEWDFKSGTGRFEGATGTGHTDGLANLLTGEAEFEFSGEITVP